LSQPWIVKEKINQGNLIALDLPDMVADFSKMG
jgi:hypothetical protein